MKNYQALRFFSAVILGVSMMSATHAEGFEHHRPDSIRVNGLGKVSVRPDKADVNLAVEIHAKTAKAAREQAAKASSDVINAVKDLGIAEKDIQTSYVSLSQEYATDGNKIIGYQLSNQLTVCVRDVDKAGAVIDTAVQAGGNATRVQGLTFGVDNTAESMVKAREKAYEDALVKAKQYAKLAGRNLGKAMHISEGTNQPPAPIAYGGERMLKATMSADTPVQAGEQEISVTVDVVFGIE